MLARHRNFARAAKALHISQPTLSRSIQLLEKTVGDRAYEYWILGLDVNQREPLWSAVRDVLHWVDWPVNSP